MSIRGDIPQQPSSLALSAGVSKPVGAQNQTQSSPTAVQTDACGVNILGGLPRVTPPPKVNISRSQISKSQTTPSQKENPDIVFKGFQSSINAKGELVAPPERTNISANKEMPAPPKLMLPADAIVITPPKVEIARSKLAGGSTTQMSSVIAKELQAASYSGPDAAVHRGAPQKQPGVKLGQRTVYQTAGLISKSPTGAAHLPGRAPVQKLGQLAKEAQATLAQNKPPVSAEPSKSKGIKEQIGELGQKIQAREGEKDKLFQEKLVLQNIKKEERTSTQETRLGELDEEIGKVKKEIEDLKTQKSAFENLSALHDKKASLQEIVKQNPKDQRARTELNHINQILSAESPEEAKRLNLLHKVNGEQLKTAKEYLENVLLTKIYLQELKAAGASQEDMRTLEFGLDKVLQDAYSVVEQFDQLDAGLSIDAYAVEINKITTQEDRLSNVDWIARQSEKQSVIAKLGQNKKTKSAMEAITSQPRFNGKNLDSYAIAPMQRVGKFPLLAREAGKYAADETREQIGELEAKAAKNTTEINEAVRVRESLVEFNGFKSQLQSKDIKQLVKRFHVTANQSSVEFNKKLELYETASKELDKQTTPLKPQYAKVSQALDELNKAQKIPGTSPDEIKRLQAQVNKAKKEFDEAREKLISAQKAGLSEEQKAEETPLELAETKMKEALDALAAESALRQSKAQNVTNAVRTMVLQEADVNKRVELLSTLQQLATALYKENNYSQGSAVVAALITPPLSRLHDNKAFPDCEKLATNKSFKSALADAEKIFTLTPDRAFTELVQSSGKTSAALSFTDSGRIIDLFKSNTGKYAEPMSDANKNLILRLRQINGGVADVDETTSKPVRAMYAVTDEKQIAGMADKLKR